ncbi:putative phosphoglycerate mutase [Phycisphaerales bacterium]|nr:putative phosphoglycerate mutase [Phycisphaerales bacterium]
MLLLVLRHAKAEKDSPTGRDEDRPLSDLGRRQAEFIGSHLLRPGKGLKTPALILSSPAARARTTAEIIAKALGLKVGFDDSLGLGADTREALQLVRQLAQAEHTALIVGHNPQFEDLAAELGQRDDRLRTGELIGFDITLDGTRVLATEVATVRLEED